MNVVESLANGDLALSIDCGTDDFFLEVNRRLHAKLQARGVFHVDVNHVFLRPDGTIHVGLMWDLLHPNAAGAEAWVQAVEPTLAQLMGDTPIVDSGSNDFTK